MDIVLWVLVLSLLLVVVIAASVPVTRPYVEKFWWLAVLLIVPVLGLILFRRRPGRPVANQGAQISQENLRLMDVVVEHAEEQSLRASAELQMRQLQADGERKAYTDQLSAINSVTDGVARRQALIKLVGGTR